MMPGEFSGAGEGGAAHSEMPAMAEPGAGGESAGSGEPAATAEFGGGAEPGAGAELAEPGASSLTGEAAGPGEPSASGEAAPEASPSEPQGNTPESAVLGEPTEPGPAHDGTSAEPASDTSAPDASGEGAPIEPPAEPTDGALVLAGETPAGEQPGVEPIEPAATPGSREDAAPAADRPEAPGEPSEASGEPSEASGEPSEAPSEPATGEARPESEAPEPLLREVGPEGPTAPEPASQEPAAAGQEAAEADRTVDRAEVWKMDARERGNVIETDLANSEYKEWFHCGKEHGGTQEHIDFFKDGVGVSLKTVESATPGSIREMQNEIGQLEHSGIQHSTDGGETWSKTELALDVRVPEGREADFASLKSYGAQHGIEVYVRPY